MLSEAFDILAKVGVFIENREAYALLLDSGAQPVVGQAVSEGIGRVTISSSMIEAALQNAPKKIRLWDIAGKNPVSLQGNQVHFDPGSAALFLHDPPSGLIRKPVTEDLRRYVSLVDRLPHYHLQSTALVSSDVPDACADSYRLYLALKHGRKPVVTGTFRKEASPSCAKCSPWFVEMRSR